MEIERSEIPGMLVCGDCGDIVGPVPGRPDRVQRGSCARHHGRKVDPRWPECDFNQHAELCRCCGAVPLQSGSRWSVWFCGPCKDEVLDLGRRHGRHIIPIGPHSFQAGLVLDGERAEDPVEVHCFVESVNALRDVMGMTAEWRRLAVRLNLEAMGCAPDAVVPVERYLEGASVVRTATRFGQMCAYLQRRATAGRDPEGGAP
jgi:hypothetical protein